MDRRLLIALAVLLFLGGVWYFSGLTARPNSWRFRSVYLTWSPDSGYDYVPTAVYPYDYPFVDSSGASHRVWGYFGDLVDAEHGDFMFSGGLWATSVFRASGVFDIVGVDQLDDNTIRIFFRKTGAPSDVYYVDASAGPDARTYVRGDSGTLLGSFPADEVDRVYVLRFGDGYFAYTHNTYGIWQLYDFERGSVIMDGRAPAGFYYDPSAGLLHYAGPYGTNENLRVRYTIYNPSSHEFVDTKYFDLPGQVLAAAVLPVDGGYRVAVASNDEGVLTFYVVDPSDGSYVSVGTFEDSSVMNIESSSLLGAYTYGSRAYFLFYDQSNMDVIVFSVTPDGYDFSHFTGVFSSVAYPVAVDGGVPIAYGTDAYSGYGLSAITYAFVNLDHPGSVYGVNSLTIDYWTPENKARFELNVQGAAVNSNSVTQYFVISIWDQDYKHNWRYVVPVTFGEEVEQKTVPITVELTSNNTFYASGSDPVSYDNNYKISVYTLDNVPAYWDLMSGWSHYYDSGWFRPADVAPGEEPAPSPSPGPSPEEVSSEHFDLAKYDVVIHTTSSSPLSAVQGVPQQLVFGLGALALIALYYLYSTGQLRIG